MKVIDLLNKIANGEEVPKKIRYDRDTYYYIEDNREGLCYINTALDRENIWSHFLYNIDTLNEEIEIIEEDKKIKKLELVSNGSPNSYALLNEYGTKCGLTKHSKIMCDKINEIIDKINSMEDK